MNIVLRRFALVVSMLMASLLPMAVGTAAEPIGRADGHQAGATSNAELPQADHILVVKHLRRLYLLRNGRTIGSFLIKLGHHPKGPKERAGDGRTPEGDYRIDWRDDKSLFTLALHISYPNLRDRERAARLHVNPGGAIEIHGEPFVAGAISPAKLRTDWTAGCIALSNADMRRVWDQVPDGTPIEIVP
ncbi:MAG TPA: L,D-transpeptidase family protein [Alphaproteobacteria bacterium]|nr:L,D-transpeptidase family protein [Alphaproteobacteria bacterium]